MRKSAPVRFGQIKARLPLTGNGQRIGLLGGTFDPPHAGHLQISRIALARLGLSQVWWLVTPGNPLKANDRLPPLEERIAACRALAVTDRRILITGLERRLRTPFTAATLAFLKQRRPQTRFVWLMGADNMAGFHRWRQWREIFATMPVAVIDRPGYHLKAVVAPAARAFAASRLPDSRAQTLPEMPPPAWTMLTGPLSPLSSTQIRGQSRDKLHSRHI